MLADVCVINKYLSVIQSKFAGIVGHGLWESDMDEVQKYYVLDLADYIKAGLNRPEPQTHGVSARQAERVCDWTLDQDS